ncbi:hypothetical protein G6F23_015148 [Rhizopus arrhizus]|nr:hypothetical protein G6F23_015148 [Rhizopus arrhizus]
MSAAPASPFMDSSELPLRGIKVLELSHMIMGPAAGLSLGDLGADVIKVEPIDGDRTRRLKGPTWWWRTSAMAAWRSTGWTTSPCRPKTRG